MRAGENDVESCQSVIAGAQRKAGIVSAQNLSGHGEADALAVGLGGVEWSEQIGGHFVGYAAAVVGDGELHALVLRRVQTYPDMAVGAIGDTYGIGGITYQIDQSLRHHIGIYSHSQRCVRVRDSDIARGAGAQERELGVDKCT